MMRKFAAIFPCVALILMMSNKAHADAASGTFDMSGYVTITPSATVDVTPIPTTVTPEPSTWLLVSTALGLLMFRRKFAR